VTTSPHDGSIQSSVRSLFLETPARAGPSGINALTYFSLLTSALRIASSALGDAIENGFDRAERYPSSKADSSEPRCRQIRNPECPRTSWLFSAASVRCSNYRRPPTNRQTKCFCARDNRRNGSQRSIEREREGECWVGMDRETKVDEQVECSSFLDRIE